MKRVVTAAVLLPLTIAAIFFLPPGWFLAVVLAIVSWAAIEYVLIARVWAPRAPVWSLLGLVVGAVFVLRLLLADELTATQVWIAAVLFSLGIAAFVLLARTPVTEVMGALGILVFGTPYFALTVVSLERLRAIDPWVLMLTLLSIWTGDAMAYYVGSAWGRHKLAPRVSPKKTWEGSAAGLAGSAAAGAVWSLGRLGTLEAAVLAVAVAAGVSGQLGDLVESMIKRGAGVKDSGTLLPGHGGMFDRIDALLLAAPVTLAVIWAVGPERLIP